MINEKHIHDGHRSRMRAKLIRHGAEIFDTYELLEMLLYHVIPYKDTNPISKQLLDKFGSLDGVLRASREELMSVNGVGKRVAELICEAGDCFDILGVDLVKTPRESFKVYSRAGRYFAELFAGYDGPRVALMLLDNNMRCISCEVIYSLDYDSGEVVPKPFIDRAMRARASVAITAHSHPYGPLFPTEGDRATNLLVTNTLKSVGVSHVEHFVVSGSRFIGVMRGGWQGLSAHSDIDEFYKSKREEIAMGLVEDPARYVPDFSMR